MSESATWSGVDFPYEVAWPHAVLERVRQCGMQGLLDLPKAGLGLGGILLGEREGRRITILDSVEIPCSHAFGPSFTLTPEEQAAGRDLIAGANGEVIGWYCTKGLRPLDLTASDRRLLTVLFPESWLIGLLLQPHMVRPSRAAFVSPDTSGEPVMAEPFELAQWREPKPEPAPVPEELHAHANGHGLHGRVILQPPEPVTIPVASHPLAPLPNPIPASVSMPVAPAAVRQEALKEPEAAPWAPRTVPDDGHATHSGNGAASTYTRHGVPPAHYDPHANGAAWTAPRLSEPQPEADTPPAEPLLPFADASAVHRQIFSAVSMATGVAHRTRTMWLLRAAMVAGIALISSSPLFFIRFTSTPIVAPPPLSIRSTEVNGALLIRWNQEAVSGFDRATLFIDDGGRLHTIELDRDELDKGELRYARQFLHVTAILKAGDSQATTSWSAPIGRLKRTKDPQRGADQDSKATEP